MALSDHLHSPVDLLPGDGPLVATGVDTLHEKPLEIVGIRTPILLSSSPFSGHYIHWHTPPSKTLSRT
jgi:hypothetical protein